MSALEQLQEGDWIIGPRDTHWTIIDPDDHDPTGGGTGYVWLATPDGGDLWVTQDEFRRKLAAGTFDHTTDRPEAEQ
jgi:hypothetical protein